MADSRSEVSREGSEGRRVGIEGRCGWSADHKQKRIGLLWHFDGTGFSVAQYGPVCVVGSDGG